MNRNRLKIGRRYVAISLRGVRVMTFTIRDHKDLRLFSELWTRSSISFEELP